MRSAVCGILLAIEERILIQICCNSIEHKLLSSLHCYLMRMLMDPDKVVWWCCVFGTCIDLVFILCNVDYVKYEMHIMYPVVSCHLQL